MASTSGVLSSPGIGSGLDIRALVEQLVAAESQPLLRVAAREAKLQEQLSAYGQLKSALSLFQDALRPINAAEDFRILTATSSDTDVLTLSVGSGATRGSFNLEVGRIAENHRLASGTTFVDPDTALVGAVGETMTIDLAGESFVIDYGGKTLSEIRTAINEAGDNTGVTASLLRDDAGYRLYLAADADGSANLVTVDYSAADPFTLQAVNQDRDGSGGFTAADLDAEVLVEDLYTVTSSSNTISDAIAGVTLQLVAPGTSRITIEHDRAKVERNVQGFVDGYNKLVQSLRALGQGGLSADRAALLRLEASLRAELNAALPEGSAVASIFDLGVSSRYTVGSSSGDNGLLAFDASKLRAALATDTDGVAALFAGQDSGVISRLEGLVSSYLQGTGIIAGKEQALDARIDAMADRRADMELRLETLQSNLMERFNALDTLLGQLQSTQTYLTQQLQTIQIRRDR
ncbi:MAG: flagellar filament capping protein FliD [Gammaproteobacteria bacterium]|nr:flagellar filament capping protein FliD [Gammaproteobacteria bacterium]